MSEKAADLAVVRGFDSKRESLSEVLTRNAEAQEVALKGLQSLSGTLADVAETIHALRASVTQLSHRVADLERRLDARDDRS